VIQLPTKQAFCQVLSGFSGLWNRVLRSVSNKSGVDIFERKEGGTWKDSESVWISRAEPLRKRADRYLAKYMSKSMSKDAKGFFPPTRWYGVSRSLINEMKSKIRHVCTHESESVRHEITEKDLDFLSYVKSKAHLERCFVDKVGTGSTFVFYVEDYEEIMNEAERIFGKRNDPGAMVSRSDLGSKILTYTAIERCASRADLFEALQADLGDYYRKLLYRWMDESPVEESELFWIEYYARRLLYLRNVSYKGQPPERSGAGLPSTNDVKLENSSPPCPEPEQPSLFP
jgi:hypothetical protein